jgi:hypothetical protein
LIDVVSFGIPSRPPEHTKQVLKGVHPGIRESDKLVIWGGGVYDWLDPISATVALNGLIDDDGASPVTILWTVDDPNNVTITSPTALVTTATIDAAVTRTFTLTATDGAGSLGDTMDANVYDDACAAAIGDPAQTLASDISGPSGDSDCVVNLYDFAAMAINWLDCASTKLGCTP